MQPGLPVTIALFLVGILASAVNAQWTKTITKTRRITKTITKTQCPGEVAIKSSSTPASTASTTKSSSSTTSTTSTSSSTSSTTSNNSLSSSSETSSAHKSSSSSATSTSSSAPTPTEAPYKCGGDVMGWCPEYQVCRINAYMLTGIPSRNNPRPQYVCKNAPRSCAEGRKPGPRYIEWGWCPDAKFCQYNHNNWTHSCVDTPEPIKCGTIVGNGPWGDTRSELGVCNDPEYQFCRPVTGPNERHYTQRCCRSDLPRWDWYLTKECLQ